MHKFHFRNEEWKTKLQHLPKSGVYSLDEFEKEISKNKGYSVEIRWTETSYTDYSKGKKEWRITTWPNIAIKKPSGESCTTGITPESSCFFERNCELFS